jgi:serpin B
MKRDICLLVLILSALAFAGCNRDFSPVSPGHILRPLTPEEKQLAKRHTNFSWKLFKSISLGENQNVIVSPLSVAFSVAMVLNGAKGETRQSILETLGLGGLSMEQINSSFSGLFKLLVSMDPNVQMEIANSVWYRKGLNVERVFINRLHTFFQAEIQALNFDDPLAVRVVNRWVEEKTHGKIKRIVDRFDGVDMMCLMNALYFKAMWTIQFDKQDTKNDTFTIKPGRSIAVKMMSVINDFEYTETALFQAINLPYGSRHFRMTILLPKEGIPVDSVIARLSTSAWEQWQASMKQMRGWVKMPKFKETYKKSLVEPLAQLGMKICFTPQKADFSGITTQKELYISEVLHKTFVAVDEEGTEAAAVTATTLTTVSFPTPDIRFTMNVNRPFLFVIWDHYTRSVLFAGKMVRPIFNEERTEQ